MTTFALIGFIVYAVLLCLGLAVARRINNVKPKRLPPKDTLVVWLVLGGLAWLDHGRTIHAHDAAVWSFITTAVGVIGDFFATVGAAVETALAAVVSALAAAMSWVLGALKTFIGATGSVFSKVWDGLKVVWNDVLKPVIAWIDEELGKLKVWLKDTFGPIFDWLKTVRDTLTNIYKRFLKPILNFIDLVHGLDQLLQVFHIRVLAGLDATLEALEQRLEEPLLWLNSKINQILGVLTIIITADGLFQRVTLIKSLARDVDFQWRILVNSYTRPLSGLEGAQLHRAVVTQPAPDLIASLGVYLGGEQSDAGDTIDAVVSDAVDFWNSFGDTQPV